MLWGREGDQKGRTGYAILGQSQGKYLFFFSETLCEVGRSMGIAGRKSKYIVHLFVYCPSHSYCNVRLYYYYNRMFFYDYISRIVPLTH